jgi:hypothetical protein
MKKMIMTLAAVSAIAMAAPAAAQTTNMQARIQQLHTDIQAGVRNRTLTQTEARALRQDLQGLRQLERQYSANGLSMTERQDLQNRIMTLRQNIRFAARNDDLRNNNRFGQSNWIDRNNDGWDDRDYNRDGRIDSQGYNSGYAGQGGPFDEVNQVCGMQQSGIAGVIGSLFGGDNCLSIGERAPNNLGGLPYQYRNQFRDTGSFYHRYINGNVVQIDARTQVVTRIYDVN